MKWFYSVIFSFVKAVISFSHSTILIELKIEYATLFYLCLPYQQITDLFANKKSRCFTQPPEIIIIHYRFIIACSINYFIFYQRDKTKSMAENNNKVLKLLRLCWRYNVTTSTGRRVQSLKIIGVAMIAITGLLVFVAEDVNNARDNIKKAEILEKNLESSLQVALLIHRLQIERGLTVLCLGSKSAEDKDRVFEKLSDARHNTDKVLEETEWPFDETVATEFLRGAQNFKRRLRDHR